MLKGLLIRHDCKIKKAKFYSTEGMQRAVGGYIEIVQPKELPASQCMIVNEEGALKGLPLNQIGTYLYGAPIVGNILILGQKRNELGALEFTDLTYEEMQELIVRLRR